MRRWVGNCQGEGDGVGCGEEVVECSRCKSPFFPLFPLRNCQSNGSLIGHATAITHPTTGYTIYIHRHVKPTRPRGSGVIITLTPVTTPPQPVLQPDILTIPNTTSITTTTSSVVLVSPTLNDSLGCAPVAAWGQCGGIGVCEVYKLNNYIVYSWCIPPT